MSRRLVIAMTSLVALVAIALAVPMALVVATDQRAAFVSDLETDTLAAASLLSSQPFIDWQTSIEEVAQRTGARVVVVDAGRTLVADSDDSGLDRTFDRPEISDALAGLVASDIRYSRTLATNLRYVAAPVIQNFQIVAAVRLSLPEYDVDEAIRGTLLWLIAFVISVVMAAALIAWLLARSIAAPLRRLADVAEALPDDLELRADAGSGPPEVRKVATALNATALRLSGILSRTQRVAADASHHLRTPLTGVRLRLEAIEETTSDRPVAEEAAAAINEVDRLTRRIDQILALARSDIGAGEARAVDVAPIVRDRVDAAGPIAGERGITVRFTATSGTEALVEVPVGTVERNVDELLGNALAYARSAIEVKVEVDDAWVVLQVSDDGPGLPEQERSDVFQRFVRGSEAAPGGSGLGLALVSESAQALGGDATAQESELGGLTVRVRFPRATASTDG